jgi:serine/threonine-protein kinase
MGGAPGPGGELAGYRIQSVLGKGGMGIVYLAERPQGGLCALKVLSSQLGVDPSFAARFKREAEYADALDHSHILELYEAGETSGGTLFFAMQYVSGADLGVLLARDGVLDLALALSIMGQVGDALDCAHAKGLIHRDVKPGNIIVAIDRVGGPYAYLSDFGLSKNPSEDSVALTRQGQFIGTAAYTAPEEILAQPRDHLLDVYSLGCVLYEALVGVPPFLRDRDLDVLYAHIGDPRPNVTDHRADLPPEIDAVIAKAMAISPADRFSSCAEFIAAACALLPEGAVPAAEEAAATGTAPVESPAPAASASVIAPATDLAAARSEALRLVVRAGFGLGRDLIVDDELAVGRLTTLGGALASDLGISRRHARVLRAADGGFVNGERIVGPHPLRPGDELGIGSTVFVVTTSEPAAPGPGASDPVAQERDARAPIPDLVAEPSPSQTAKRLVVRLELDFEAGELVVRIENGASARIVREGDGWRVQAP